MDFDPDLRFDVAGLGNALVDALVRFDDTDFLARSGYTRGHMTPVDHEAWEAAYELVREHGVEIASGGSCANTIAALGLLGARSVYCGQIGRDAFGQLYARRMEEACGTHALSWTDAAPTGKCLSIVSATDAERTMLTDLGAAVTMDSIEHFDPILRDSKLLHLTGYLLLGEPMKSRAMEAVAIANQQQVPISLDVADPFVVGVTKEDMWHLIEEFCDVVFLNAEEARALTGEEPLEALEKLREDVEVVVLKLGSAGSLVADREQVVEIGVHKVDAVDTTGAGDAYAAGFLYGLVNGWPLRESAELGSRVAGLTVAQLGAVVRDRAVLQGLRDGLRPVGSRA